MNRRALWLVLFVLLFPAVPQADPLPQEKSSVPRLVKFSGRVGLTSRPVATATPPQVETGAEPTGRPGPAVLAITFAVYAEEKSGTALWQETQNVEVDAEGRYNVLLGAASPHGLPMDLFASNEARWLGARAATPGDAAASREQPRVVLVSVPYALRAADAETLGGQPASAYAMKHATGETVASGDPGANAVTPLQVTGTGTTGRLALFTSPTSVGDSLLSQSGSRISVGGGIDFGSDFSFPGNAEPAPIPGVQIFNRAFQGLVIRGLNTIFETLQGQPAVPTETFRITQFGTGRFTGNTGSTNSSVFQSIQNGSSTTPASLVSPPPTAIRGETTTTTNYVAGVSGVTGSTRGIGVAGANNNTAASDEGIGVAGIVNGFGAVGVYGENVDTGANYNIGVRGVANASGATAVEGIALATSGDAWGVNGISQSTLGIGVRGDATSMSGATVGVWSDIRSSGGDFYVGAFNGDIRFRVDDTGHGFFDAGQQTGGADFAESVEVFGDRAEYGPGDVMLIDPAGRRRFMLSQKPYATGVAGIYSTKPGVLATTHRMDDPRLADEIPLAIIGIVPCKVSAENGPVAAGDLLVTSSMAGHAMRGTKRGRMLGAVVGKALEPFDPRDAQGRPLRKASGVILVLVTLQ